MLIRLYLIMNRFNNEGENMDDVKLLKLLHKDPNTGMEQLINQYAGLVYAIVRSKLSDSYYISSDIEDCVADVFSNFYAGLSNYDPSSSSIKSYLCVIARNHAINVAKKQSYLQQNVSLDCENSFSQSIDEAMIDTNLAEDEVRQELIKAVEELGPPDSNIIFRKFYYGQSSKEIAEAMNLTVSNVDTRTHRALNKLRKSLEVKKYEENN